MQSVREKWWALGLLAAFTLTFLAMTLIFPVYQFLKTGVVYFVNGPDETSYLLYDFSRSVQAVTRPGQYLVTWAHQLGMSGGAINMLFDAVSLVAFPLTCRAIFRRLGWSELQAVVGALLLVALPMVVLKTNPIVQWLSAWNIRSGMLYWFNLPDVHYAPLARTPEPQFSLMLLALAVWAGLRWRRFWPVYASLAFMYPFVAIPTAFIALANHLRSLWRWRFPTAGPVFLAFAGVSTVCWAYYSLFISAQMRLLVIASHLPLVSFMSAIALAAYAAFRSRIEPRHRFFVLTAALAPLVASNQQLVSGHIPQPSNFEHFFGCVLVAAVFAFAFKTAPVGRAVLLALGTACLVASSYYTFRVNQSYMIRLPVTPTLLNALRDDSPDVVVNDVGLTSMLSMIYPRQAPTALASDKIFNAVSPRYIDEYRCVRRQILTDYPHGFEGCFKWLDDAYEDGGQGYLMAHINRRALFVKIHDVLGEPCRGEARRPLRYFFINWFPAPKRATPEPARP